MTVSIRELFLIVRAQNQASNTLKGVSNDLRNLSHSAGLAAKNSALADKAMRFQSTVAGARGRTYEAQKRVSELESKQSGLMNERTAALKAQATIQESIAATELARDAHIKNVTVGLEEQQLQTKQAMAAITTEISATEARRDTRMASQARYQRHFRQVQETISTGPTRGLSLNRLSDARAELEKWQNSVGKAGEDIDRYNNRIKGLNKAHASAAKFSMGMSSAIDKVGTTAGVAGKELEQYQKDIRGLNTAHSQTGKFIQGTNRSLAQNSAELQKANIAANEAQIAERNLRAEQYLNQQQLKKSNREIAIHEAGFSHQGFSKAVHAIGGMGRMLQYAGGIGVAALGFMANSAAKLSTQVTLAATQVANTTRGVGKESAKDMSFIVDQMARFPSAAEDMASGLYDIFSTLNVNGPKGRDILVQVNKAAVAGSLSVKDATAGVLSVMGNFKNFAQTGAGATQVLNRSFAAVRFGRMTMGEFQKSLQTTAPAAKQAQQSFDTLAGTMAFLSRSLGPTKAAVGFARLTEVLGSANMEKGLKKFGVSLTDANGKFLPLNKQIEILVKRFPYLAEGGQKALNFFKDIGNIQGTIQARRAFVTLTQDTAGYNRILNKTVGDNNEFAKSYAAMSASLGVQWAKFLNSLKAVGITIGTYVIPVFTELAGPIQDLVHWFQSLDEEQKKTIGKWIAYAAIGATLVGVFLSVTAAGLGFVLMLGAAEVGMAAFVNASLVFAAIAVAGYLIYKNWDKVGPVFMFVANAIKTVYDAINGLNSSIIPAIALFAALYLSISKVVQGMVLLFGEAAFIAPEIVLPIAAAVAGLYLFSKLVGGGRTQVEQMSISAQNFKDNMDKLNSSMRDAEGAAEGLVTSKYRLHDAKKAVEQYRKELDKATPGSKAYKDAQQNLARAQHDVATATKEAADAQEALNQKLSDAKKSSFSARQSLDNAMRNAAAVNTGALGKKFAGTEIGQKAREEMDKANQAIQEGINKLPELQKNYENLLAMGISPMNGKMIGIRHNLSMMIADAAHMTDKQRHNFNSINDILGRIAQPKEIEFLSNLKKDILPGVETFMKITHQVPSRIVTNFLTNHKQHQQEIAAIIAETGKIPKETQLNVLDNIKKSAIPAVVNLIRKIHGIPTKHQIDIVVAHQDRIDKARRKLERLKATQTHVRTEGALGGAITADTSGVDKQVQKAQRALDKLQHRKTTATIFLKSSPKDASGWGETLGVGIKGGIVAGVDGLRGELAAALNKDISGAIADVKLAHGITSPSKETKKLIGIPLIQGVIEGVKQGGKTGLRDAMNTAVDTMMSVLQEKTQMFQDQMGELFSGGTLQTKIDWGEKLNIGDLTRDLKKQEHTFSAFQQGIAKLGKKHVPLALQQEIQALGPEHQAELDALVHATPRQLRKYVNLWKKTHREISHAATRATKSQLKMWRQQGANVALGFMSGMESQQPQMVRFFRRMFLGLYNQVTATHKSHSPSKLYMEEGVNVMMGFQLGMARQARKQSIMRSFGVAPVGGLGSRNAGVTEHHDHTHYHIPSNPPPNLMTQLRREDYHRRRRR